MPCTVKKTFRGRQGSGVALIVQVKGNQPTLEQTTAEIVAEAPPVDSHHEDHQGRGRFESRTVSIFEPGENSTGAIGSLMSGPSFRLSVSSTPAPPAPDY